MKLHNAYLFYSFAMIFSDSKNRLFSLLELVVGKNVALENFFSGLVQRVTLQSNAITHPHTQRRKRTNLKLLFFSILASFFCTKKELEKDDMKTFLRKIVLGPII